MDERDILDLLENLHKQIGNMQKQIEITNKRIDGIKADIDN